MSASYKRQSEYSACFCQAFHKPIEYKENKKEELTNVSVLIHRHMPFLFILKSVDIENKTRIIIYFQHR